ncbi:gephyrin-like molybdotransferase Glp [Humibacter sp. RRB41]|uniref:molybdopterin molybdotransferase MoeA n=1 Tax=Humibacter sp. RRB41 TaxID=2919946 RepID=UPI001FA9DCEA|nr:gephyrin-like molybdotransferase Glp [Humibacter sp. RRB41]
MITVDEHLARVLVDVRPLEPESVRVDLAYGRMLATDVVCVHPSPPFDNSAMDGYAVRRGDLLEATPGSLSELRVVGEVAAGSADDPLIESGSTVRIMTGAPVPTDADAVVPIERTAEADWAADRVTVTTAPRPGANIRRRGEDLAVGDLVLSAGRVMTPYDVAAAVSSGVERVEVRARARVAVIATGDEVRPPGVALRRGSIHDSNSPLVCGLAAAAGADVVHRSRAGDLVGELDLALQKALRYAPHVVILTGGVSVGAHDPVTRLDLQFAKVAMQPGKPQAFGRLGGAAVFGLPGNPVGAAVSFDAFVLPLLRTLHGLPSESPTEVAVAETGWAKPPMRRQYMPVVARRVDGGLHVRPANDRGSGSHLIGRLARADGYAVIPAESAEVRVGDLVPVTLRP